MNPQPEKKSRPGMVTLVVIVAMCALSVPCVGILSAIAIPAFIGYLTRAKTAEASSNLQSLFVAADGYYADENWGASGVGDSAANTACLVGSGITPNTPSAGKSVVTDPGESFDALGFSLRDPVYFQYEIVSAGGCGHSPGDPVYSFRAYGDLDGDGVTSLYEMVVGVGPDGALRRAPGIYTENELE